MAYSSALSSAMCGVASMRLACAHMKKSSMSGRRSRSRPSLRRSHSPAAAISSNPESAANIASMRRLAASATEPAPSALASPPASLTISANFLRMCTRHATLRTSPPLSSAKYGW